MCEHEDHSYISAVSWSLRPQQQDERSRQAADTDDETEEQNTKIGRSSSVAQKIQGWNSLAVSRDPSDDGDLANTMRNARKISKQQTNTANIAPQSQSALEDDVYKHPPIQMYECDSSTASNDTLQQKMLVLNGFNILEMKIGMRTVVLLLLLQLVPLVLLMVSLLVPKWYAEVVTDAEGVDQIVHKGLWNVHKCPHKIPFLYAAEATGSLQLQMARICGMFALIVGVVSFAGSTWILAQLYVEGDMTDLNITATSLATAHIINQSLLALLSSTYAALAMDCFGWQVSRFLEVYCSPLALVASLHYFQMWLFNTLLILGYWTNHGKSKTCKTPDSWQEGAHSEQINIAAPTDGQLE